METTDDDEDLTAVWTEFIVKGRRYLMVALAAGVIAFFTVFVNSVGAFAVFWITTVVTGFAGIRNASIGLARGESDATGTAVTLGALLVPIINILMIAYYLMRAGSGLAELEGLRAQKDGALARAKARHAATSAINKASTAAAQGKPAAQPSSAQQSAPRMAAAPPASTAVDKFRDAPLVRVKHYIGPPAPGSPPRPEASPLMVKIPEGTGMTQDDLPIFAVAKGAFAVNYVFDDGDHFTVLNEGLLRRLKLERETLHQVAVHNLANLVNKGKPGLKLLPQEGGFYGLVMGGDFEASLILLDDLWDGPLKEQTPNGAIVTIPAPDMCAFCDAASAKGIAELRRIAERVTRTSKNLVTDKLFKRVNGKWEELDPKPADLPPLELR